MLFDRGLNVVVGVVRAGRGRLTVVSLIVNLQEPMRADVASGLPLLGVEADAEETTAEETTRVVVRLNGDCRFSQVEGGNS